MDTGGIWRTWNNHQSVQTERLEGAHLLSNPWQASLAAPIVERSYLGQSYAGLGDVSTDIG